ncbi:RasGEF domain-containing protein [Parachlamydia sp. AcF125]|uniref:RasGEF domain-containing protein n=1 Tax=Parachlamydia sp. AcF125 TaxID=2795736 RepID=UPI001BCA2229|nr:RasGEF domain-containing protein [Parachlamydia sp. AcF125]MBS4168480.1 hypothetical protein [Parachlamydia sp. AcF125]
MGTADNNGIYPSLVKKFELPPSEAKQPAAEHARESISLGRKFKEILESSVLSSLVSKTTQSFKRLSSLSSQRTGNQSLRTESPLSAPPNQATKSPKSLPPLPNQVANQGQIARPQSSPPKKPLPPLPNQVANQGQIARPQSSPPKKPLPPLPNQVANQGQIARPQSSPPKKPLPPLPNQVANQGQIARPQSSPPKKPLPPLPNQVANQVSENRSFMLMKSTTTVVNQPLSQSAPDISTRRRLPPAKPLPPIPKITQILERSSVGALISNHSKEASNEREKVQESHSMKLESIAPKKESVKFIPAQLTPQSEIDAVSPKSVAKLSELIKRQPLDKKLVKEFAEVLHRETDAHYKNLDIEELTTTKIEKVSSFQTIVKYAEEISYSIGNQILEEKDVNKRAAIFSFYAEVGKTAAELGDFCVALAIASIFTSTPVERLNQTINVMPQESKEAYELLKKLINPSGNFNNLRLAESEFKERTGQEPLPAPTNLSKGFTALGESGGNNSQVIDKLLSPLIAIKQAESTPPPPQSATILNRLSFKESKELNNFIKENNKKLKALAKKFGTESAKVKPYNEHISEYLYSLSLKREPRKR